MSVSSIEWTDRTWNPVRGCSRVSEGCRNCYAERIAVRMSGPGQWGEGFAEAPRKHGQTGRPTTGVRGKWTGKVEFIPSALDKPLRWRKPRRVFVNSMSDLFHESLQNEAIERVFAVMALAPQHTFQILTKRPERMRQWFASGVPGMETREEDVARAAEHQGSIVWDSRGAERHLYPPGAGDVTNRRRWPGWPLPNVWLGVSVEDQATADERIPLLLQTPAAVRFVSYEPALGPVDFGRWIAHCNMLSSFTGDEGPVAELGRAPRRWRCDGCDLVVAGESPHGQQLHWIIVGGESGPGARPFDVAWARSTVAQCRAAGVAVFVKQLGARPFLSVLPPGWTEKSFNFHIHAGGWDVRLTSKKGGDPSEWPADLRVRQMPT